MQKQFAELHMDFSQIDQVTQHLKVLSNPDRLKILCILGQREFNVQEIAVHTDIQQPTLSQQLTILRRYALVHTRREGKQIYYQLSDPKVRQLIMTLHHLYCSDPSALD